MTDAAIRVAAIDLGASSGRVVVGHGNKRGFALREVSRFANRPRPVGGVLRWDARALFAGILDGLRAASQQAGPLDAVAVDGWAVDYGLLDGDGGLIADPANYRDPRTEPPFAAVTGSCEAGTWLPTLARNRLPNTFHCTPSARPASRCASMKRTSSMICCGCVT